MPYIKDKDRARFDEPVDNLVPLTPGELNYIITRLIKNYVEDVAARDERSVSYQDINDVLGALEGARLEFYRRLVVPYEDGKKKENGDVY